MSSVLFPKPAGDEANGKKEESQEAGDETTQAAPGEGVTAS